MNPTQAFSRARELLLRNRTDYDAAVKQFEWPRLRRFNWGIDWFDEYARGNTRTGLRIVHDGGDKPREVSASFAELSERSTRVASWMHARGVEKGDRILLMLPNTMPLWELMLAAMKLGAVIIPATTQLTREDLADRISRGNVRHAVAEASVAGKLSGFDVLRTRLVVGGSEAGWTPFDEARSGKNELPSREPTSPDDPLLLYFTSGTTARPKLVLHTQQSYPVGHLSTMYWIGMREGDVHENISSPGWAKHAWSSFFAPWNAGATILVHDAPRFNAARTIALLREKSVATLCCPPTVWRMLVLENLGARPSGLRELLSAGEPLNPEVIEKVQKAWGVTIRDGYGQTETTAQIGNSPGQPIKLGSMGRALPGYQAALLDAQGKEAEEGEIALRLEPRPLGLMAGLPRRSRPDAGGDRGRFLSHRRRGHARQGRLLHVRRARRRRLQVVRLPHQPLRAGEHAHRAPGGRGGGHHSQPGSAALLGGQVLRRAQAGLPALGGPGARHPLLHQGEAGAVQAHPPPRVRRAAQDHLGKDPPGGVARAGEGTARRGETWRAGVLAGGLRVRRAAVDLTPLATAAPAGGRSARLSGGRRPLRPRR